MQSKGGAEVAVSLCESQKVPKPEDSTSPVPVVARTPVEADVEGVKRMLAEVRFDTVSASVFVHSCSLLST
jgi:hypothetical protein